jgi:cyclase
MLKTRIIPTLLVKDIGLVKGVGFDSWRRVGTVLPAIKVYNTREVDELIVSDITATIDGREPDYEHVEEYCAECFCPLTIGGGIRTIENIRKLLMAGADKVSINTAAIENSSLISEGAQRFGSQCIVVAVDVKRTDDGLKVMSHSGSRPTDLDLVEWVERVETLGAGEIVITSVDRDGTMDGYDLDMIRMVTDAVSIPVIASGGAGNYQHMYEAIRDGGASAVAAASIFHFTEQTPLEVKEYMGSKGLQVRKR